MLNVECCVLTCIVDQCKFRTYCIYAGLTCLSSISDELLKGFMVCYKELDTPEGRDQCCSAIEQRFFPPIWSPLLAVIRYKSSNVCPSMQKVIWFCRRSKERSERSLAAVMSVMYHSEPKDFSVQDRLCLGVWQIIYVVRNVHNRVAMSRESLSQFLMNYLIKTT
jgi:hypothetical protein